MAAKDCLRPSRGVRPLMAMLLVAMAVVTVDAQAAQDPPIFRTFPYGGEDWVTGYLTWNSGVAGISWKASSPTEATGPLSARPESQVTGAVGWTAATHGVPDGGLRPFTEFVSEPLPSTLHLNVSRLVMLNLTMAKGDCRTLDVQLRMESTFLGGEVAGRWPGYPSGVGCVAYRWFHPEVATLQQGQVLKLKVYHQGESSVQLDGPLRASIRFPVFSESDRYFRVPSEAGAQASPAAEGGQAVGLSVFAILALAGLPRRRRSAAIVVLLLAFSAALSGCIGDSGVSKSSADPSGTAGPVGGKVQSRVVANQNTTNGSITGFIHDPDRFPVAKAHISLIGRERFTTSDHGGRFTFGNLAPGRVEIRVDASSFKPYEGSVELAPGDVLRVEIEMEPLVAGSGDLGRHRHDYWEGPSEVVFDELVEFGDGACATNYGVAGGDYSCIQEFRLPPTYADGRPVRILPGTDRLDAVVTWPAGAKIARLGFGFASAVEDGFQYAQRGTFMYPRGSGEPVHVPLTWELTDAGHQRFTSWKFALWIPTEEGHGLAAYPASVAQTWQGPFKVTLTIHKGVVPLEPGHREFWGGNQSLVVIDQATTSLQQCTTGGILGHGCRYPMEDAGQSKRGWQPADLIPPDTRWLEITFELSKQTTPSYGWTIAYKPADLPPRAPNDFSHYTTLPAGAGLKTTWVLVLKAEQVDQFYFKKSNWDFRIDDSSDDRHTYFYEVTATQVKFNVVAYRTPPPT